MRIFVAGATGVVGRRLIPMLVAGGHQVTATTRTAEKADGLRTQGAVPVVVDGLNRNGVIQAVVAARPEVIVHQMSALASMHDLKKFDEGFAVTNRLRTEGTEHLLAAARAAGTRAFVAQSYTGWPNERQGGRVKTEDDALDANPPSTMVQTLDAIRTLERLVTHAPDITGIALRYGSFYGPGTSLSDRGEIVEMLRQRKFPLVGNGAGIWSFIHVDDAARATQLAIESSISGTSGIFNIVDDDPAEVTVWLPELARILGAKPPRHVPAWLARFVIGESGVSMMTRVRGASNAKARSALGWQLQYPSWREGFRRGLSGVTLSAVPDGPSRASLAAPSSPSSGYP